MDLYICSTYYHVLITVLKALENNNKFDIAITHYIPQGKTLLPKLADSGLFNNILFLENLDNRSSNRFKNLFVRTKYFVKKIEHNLKIDFLSYSEIYLFMDDIWEARYFKDKHIYYNVIEDGLNSFKSISKSPFAYMVNKNIKKDFKWFIKKLFPFHSYSYKYYLNCKYIKSIEINDLNGIVLPNDERIIVKPRSELFEQLRIKDNCDKVLSIFLTDRTLLAGDNLAIIFTYAFVADGMIKYQKDQCDLYQKLVDKYCKYYTVLLKPHPRDFVDYSNLKHVKILPKNFPSELIQYLDDGKVKKFISIYSSSVFSYPSDKVDFFNLEDFQ